VLVGEAAVTAEPEDQMATAAAGHSRLRASDADREQVIDMLKAGFVHGRVTKDEFEARVGQAFASRTYGELAAVTADIPAGQIADQPPSKSARPPVSHVAKARRFVVIALALMMVATFAPGGPALLLFAPLCLTALTAAAAQILASQHEKRSRGQLAGLSGSGAGR
jgi:type III secretory pathway component EscV